MSDVDIQWQVHIEFREGQDKVELEGPPEDVEQVKKHLEEITKDLLARMDYAEIEVEQKYHKHVIGRAGANGEHTQVIIRLLF